MIQTAMAFHVTLENDSCRDFIYQRLILPSLLFQSAFNHRLMSQDRCKPFINVLDGDFRM